MKLAATHADWYALSPRKRFTAVVIGAVRFAATRAVYWLPAVACIAIAGQFFSVSFNVTPSLPERAFLVLKFDKALIRGDHVSFLHPGGGPYLPGAPFVKIVLGVPGDLVTQQDGRFYVNGRYVSSAKPVSSRGYPLEPGPTGVIPPDHYYVHTPHPDSFDSRYKATGWVSAHRVIGRAIPLF